MQKIMASLDTFKKIDINKGLKRINKFKPRSLLGKIFGQFSYDVGIDLGTANTLVWVRGKGIVIREPSVIARHRKGKDILAIGASAKRMLGKAPGSIEVVRPLKNGVISDFDATSAMLSHYIKAVHESHSVIPKIPRPRVVIGIPSGVTEVERRAVSDAATDAGAREAHLIEEPLAAAIGAGLSVGGSDGLFIVDIGGGTTEIAVISLGGIVLGRSLRIAGDEMTKAIINYMRLKYSLLLGEYSAEEIKNNIGTTMIEKKKFMVVRGRDLEKGLPKSIKISNQEVQEALMPIVREIIGNIVDVLEETPPELVADIMKSGIYMTGGGSLLDKIDKVVSEEVKIMVNIVDDPLTSVVRGCGAVLDDRGLLNKIQVIKSN